MHKGDHLLLYTDGISEVLADEDGGGAEERFTSVDRTCAAGGGARLLDTILADVHHERWRAGRSRTISRS